VRKQEERCQAARDYSVARVSVTRSVTRHTLPLLPAFLPSSSSPPSSGYASRNTGRARRCMRVCQSEVARGSAEMIGALHGFAMKPMSPMLIWQRNGFAEADVVRQSVE